MIVALGLLVTVVFLCHLDSHVPGVHADVCTGGYTVHQGNSSALMNKYTRLTLACQVCIELAVSAAALRAWPEVEYAKRHHSKIGEQMSLHLRSSRLGVETIAGLRSLRRTSFGVSVYGLE